MRPGKFQARWHYFLLIIAQLKEDGQVGKIVAFPTLKARARREKIY
jgi:hypothetical protein